MCSGVQGIIDSVIQAVRKVWDFVRKYLAIIIFVVAICFPYVWPLVASYLPAGVAAAIEAATVASATWGATATSLTALAIRGVVGLGFAFLLDSETATEIVDKVVDIAKSVASAATSVIDGVVGTVATSLFSSPLGIALIGIAGFWLLGSGKRDSRDEVLKSQENDLVVN